MITLWVPPRAPATARSQREGGQALVEFALVLIPLLTLLFGIIQSGFLFGGQTGLVNAAREGARYAATLQAADSTTTTADAAATLKELKIKILPRSVPGYLSSNLVETGLGSTAVCYIAYPNADSATYSVRVRVQIKYRHPLYIPIVGTIVDGIDGTPGDNAFTLAASEEMRVENPPLSAAPTGLPTCP